MRDAAVVRKIAVAVVAMAVAMGTGGCGMSQERSDAQERSDLLARPSVESAVGQLDAMLVEIRKRWQDELGIDGWRAFGDPSRAGCGVGLTDFEERGTPQWSREGPIPEDKWPRAMAIVGDVGARYGFEPPFAFVSKPGIHDAYVRGPFGAEVTFGSSLNVTLGATTGCHPLAAAKAAAR